MSACDLELVGTVRNSSVQSGICPDGLKFAIAQQLAAKVHHSQMDFETRQKVNKPNPKLSAQNLKLLCSYRFESVAIRTLKADF